MIWYQNLFLFCLSLPLFINAQDYLTTTLAGPLDFNSGYENGYGTNTLFYFPVGVTMSSDGSYALVADVNHAIRKIILSTGYVSTFVGSPTGYYGHVNGYGTNALFDQPYGVSISSDGSFALVAEANNHAIRKIILSTAYVSTFVGSPTGFYGHVNGYGTNALFDRPCVVTISSDGSFALVADSEGINHAIRKIILSTANVSTLAGSSSFNYGYVNGYGTNALFYQPYGLPISSDGSYALVGDFVNSAIRKIILSTGYVSTFAGSLSGSSGHVNGYGTNALFYGPVCVTISFGGSFALVADYNNHAIRKIILSTAYYLDWITFGSSGYVNGYGTNAQFYRPFGVAISSDGSSAIVTDNFNHVIRRLSKSPTYSLFVSEITCPGYVTSQTANATMNYDSCSFYLCPNQSMTISFCDGAGNANGGNCMNEPYLRLFDSEMKLVLGGNSSSSWYYESPRRYLCELMTIHEGCVDDVGCIGELTITTRRLSEWELKYSIGVIYNETSIMPSNSTMLIRYVFNQGTGNIVPFPFSAPSSYTMTVDDIPPRQGWLLIKWRPVIVNVFTNEISVGDWIGSQHLKAGILTSWIVSLLNFNIMGFILKDVQTHLSLVYLFKENSLVSQISIQFNTSFHLQSAYLDEIAVQHAYLSIPSLTVN